MIAQAPPAVTAWLRVEGDPRDPTTAGPLQVRVRDPLWMLARQWQVGEFAGTDAGSPVQATYGIRRRRLSAFIPNAGPSLQFQGAPPGTPPIPPFPAGTAPPVPLPPVEMHVEQEPVIRGLRFRFSLGMYFEGAVAAAAPGSTAIADCRIKYPILSAVLTVDDTPASQFFGLVGNGAATDGVALLADVVAWQGGGGGVPASVSALPAPLLNDFVTYGKTLYQEPAPGTNSWSNDWLQYEFGLSAKSANSTVSLTATDFPGGKLDWFSFSLAPGSGDLSTDAPQFLSFLPTHLSFRGAPKTTWWHFEDGQTDFGQLDVEKTNLPALLVSEFAVVYGNDWFVVPVPMEVGSLASIDIVVVADTFGVRTLIRPTAKISPPGAVWTMFALTGSTAAANMVLLAPMLGSVEDGPELEIVEFLRDDMAAMCWGVERRIQGPMDNGIDAFESFLIRTNGEAAPPPNLDPTTEVAYQLGTKVPDNWIPLVPQLDPAKPPMRLQRGAMERIVVGPGGAPTPKVIGPYGVILSPTPMIVADQAVPNEGRNVARYFRRARLIDGSLAVWLGRQTRPGRGPGSSGLLFDQVKSKSRS